MDIIKKLAALVEVKSIVTLALVGVGCWGFMANMISGEVFAGWVSAIMVYFFNKDRKES
jgi:hypothetical protein